MIYCIDSFRDTESLQGQKCNKIEQGGLKKKKKSINKSETKEDMSGFFLKKRINYCSLLVMSVLKLEINLSCHQVTLSVTASVILN